MQPPANIEDEKIKVLAKFSVILLKSDIKPNKVELIIQIQSI
jgi:hypothetical protein